MTPPPREDPAPGGEWVTLAVLGRTRGNRGEITAVSLAGGLERYEALAGVWLFGQARLAQGIRLSIENVWQHDARLIFKFRGVDTISDAEELRGAEVRVPLAERAPLADGEFYQSDLVGCEVVDRASGEVLGSVEDFQECGGPGLLSVRRRGGGELLVPFAHSICVEIDPRARRVVVDLPEGLKELNQP